MSRSFIFYLCVAGVVAASVGTYSLADTSDGAEPEPTIRVPVIKYAVASPRACLTGPPAWSERVYYLPSGAAENFARPNGVLRVRTGTRVIFALSRELEGVWYPHSYGCLGTSLVVQWCKDCKCGEDCKFCECLQCNCQECEQLGVAAADGTEKPEIVRCPWVTIGKDGAQDCRRGPSIGRARVGVPVRFRKPGIYYLRAIIHTYAKPRYPQPLEPWRIRIYGEDAPDRVLPPIPIAQDRDVVYIRVIVTDEPATDIEPEEAPAEEPDVLYTKPMPKIVDPNEPVEPLTGDLNGDEVVDFVDLAILAQQWGKEYEMPISDD